MPVFDYRCKDCGQIYDVLHKGKEIAADVICPSCNSPRHTRLISAPAISMGGRPSTAPQGGGGCAGGTCGLN